ncbi:MAG: peptidoglycan recognition family protein [Lachnospiraceae bacterium]|nr:peptidoglycan recognition family protein [Lachnospiraceae bacterium]
MRNNGRRKRRIRWDHILIWIFTIILTVVAIWLLLRMIPKDDTDVDALLNESASVKLEAIEETEAETEKPKNPVPRPDIDEQLLTINEYSRPGDKVDAVENVVIHYLGNPKTTAQQNHDYFESLKDLQNVSMSANFVVGIEGEIIECVPPGEIAYASNSMNHLSISIENCHLDDSGRFTEETYESCVHLTAYLVAEYGLKRENIIRHYDVTGKECPLYYVEHEDKWEKFRDDVMNYIEECREAAE